MTLGVYFGGHAHPWPELLALVRHAEALGYSAAFVDGDVSMLGVRSEEDCLDGWTVTTALLASTSRIEIGSLRLVHHWNAARLAQAAASAARIAPGRFRFQIAIGDRPIDARFGLPALPPGERIAWLAETLDAVRALWRGETVTRRGEHVRLDAARVRPTPPGGRLPIAVAARRPRMLELVAAHADLWEVNLPPIPRLVARAAAVLAEACARRGRDPQEIGRTQLLFARPGEAPGPALDRYRELNPWFHEIPDAELGPSLVLGSGPECRARIEALRGELELGLPVLDCSGLAARAARELLESLAPRE